MSSELIRRRLYAQGLDRPFSSVHDAAHALTAIQAQERPASLWALGLRTLGSRISDVEEAVASRTIVRTWLFRGTLHFTTAEDVRWLLALVAPRLISRSKGRNAQLHLDSQVFELSREIITDVLDEQGQVTRSDLMAALEKKGVSIAGQRGYHILWHLALKGTICFGPMVNREPTFVLLDEWVPSGRDVTREQALEMLAVRYFSGHGPATAQDLAWWSGLTLAEVSEGIDAAGPRLHKEMHGGITHFHVTSSPRASMEPRVLLLPAFDGYVIGYKERSALLDGERSKKELSSNGVFYPALLIDGRAQGTWRGKKVRKGISIDIKPFSPVDPSFFDPLEAAAERYGSFLGVPVSVQVKREG